MEIPPEIVNIVGADVIRRFGEGKESLEAVEQYIGEMARTLPPAFIRDFIKQNTGLAEDDMPKDDAKLGEYGKNIFRLMQGSQPNIIEGQAIENVSFALRVNADNSPISPTVIFKPNKRRIYACFQNQGTLEGLTKVVTRWTNKTTKEVVKLDTKQIDPNAPFNFIWVEKREGWPTGEYAVELLSTKEFALIAQGMFTVLVEEKKEEPKEVKPDKPKEPDSPK